MHVCVLCDAKVCSLFTGEQGFMAAVLGCPLSDVVKRCVCVSSLCTKTYKPHDAGCIHHM